MSDSRQVLRRMSERFSWLADHHVTSEFAKIECQKLADECWQAQAAADQPDAGPRVKRAYHETHEPPHCPTCECGADNSPGITE